jgi:UDP-galactopyranose mutase
METDLIVVGGGISGLALAWKAARSGTRTLVLEREDRVGGCLRSERLPDGFWFEMGAHTTYNSYGAFLDVVAGTGLTGNVAERGPARGRFGLLRGGEYRWLSPPKVLLELGWLEAAVHVPFGILRGKQGETVSSYYSRLIGRRNFERVLSPLFAAVPSQIADGFPAEGPGSLFKKRPRRQEFPRSFGIRGGLQGVCEAVAATPGVEVERGVAVKRVARAGRGFAVTTADGRTLGAPLAAVAVPPEQASEMLREGFPELAETIARVKMVDVESIGAVLPRARCWMPECAFLVAAGDAFYSIVTRDTFPDPERRAFAFHFRPGVARSEKLKRVAEVLRVGHEELGASLAEDARKLPAPALGHADVVRELDRRLAGGKLALTGNYFAGLAIEECVLRSNSEWARIST